MKIDFCVQIPCLKHTLDARTVCQNTQMHQSFVMCGMFFVQLKHDDLMVVKVGAFLACFEA